MNKYCKQRLQEFGLKPTDITHVCLASNLYPLLQYILLMDDNVVFNHTYYFVNDVISEDIRKKIPCSYYDYSGRSFIQKIQRRFNKLKLRFCKYVDYPFLKSAELYAYDLPFISLCIGKRSYSLLADAPNWMTLNVQPASPIYTNQRKKANSLFGKIQRLIFGDIFVDYWGTNQQCKAVYLTEENVSPVLEGKSVYVNSLESLFDKSSDKKKQFIMNLFGIDAEIISTLNHYPNLFFSQPFMKDCGMTEEEYVDVLKQIFSHYPEESIVIKTHPRDEFDYKKYFPNVTMFSKVINSQLLYIMGVRPQKIITIASTAIEGFPETIECDYYGTSIHPKIEKYLGSNFRSSRKVNYITNQF